LHGGIAIAVATASTYQLFAYCAYPNCLSISLIFPIDLKLSKNIKPLMDWLKSFG